MNAITVTASRWQHGWELEVSEDQHTQVATLDKARQQVVDYLDTVDPDVDHSGWEIIITPEIGPLGTDVIAARDAVSAAEKARTSAAATMRDVVARLRAAGYSVSDCAGILGVSRGRISQLLKPV